MMRKRALLCLMLVLLPLAAAAQTTVPVWARPDLFWYRKTTPAGNLWLKVDAQQGVKEPLFDHQRLAIEISLRSGIDYTSMTLPLADPSVQFVVKYDGSNAYIQQGAMAIEFIHGDQQWRCDLQIKWNWNLVPPTDYECLPRRPAVRGQAAKADTPRVSPDGRWEAFIQNHNVAIRSVGGNAGSPTMLSSDGTANAEYQFGSIRWSPDSLTVGAYRVDSAIWNSDSINENVKRHIAKGEWKVPR